MIDTNTYLLSKNNYNSIESSKKYIIIAHTFNNNMKHVIGWKHRLNGNYKKTAPFSIDTNGVIYNHFDPKYHSEFLNNKELDKNSIVILIENDGWLIKDDEKNLFIGCFGDIYRGEDVIEKRWRGYNYWAP